ncbi:dynein axonemal intermediate chain 7 isoform X3 [Mobula birostris]|uniref:dynein axonemal intermediate chain 7 isoform X3 n=1 Tax=Mobula birostris TaxID=1983395 RepID=UPI003B2834F1
MTSVRSSAASKKKRSKSAEKLMKQEEEKKHLEEEELRLAAEQLEREILEQKRLEEEERARIAAEDKARKDNELPELFQILERNMASVQRLRKNLREVSKWQRYMKCDGTPDPTIPQEINSFINLSKEDPDRNIKSLFEGSRIILELLDELEMLLRDTPSDELLETTTSQYQQTIWDLQTLLSNINDRATDILLQKAIDLVDIETGNMQEVVKDENITLCLWANFNKNPRFKGYEFVNNHMEFELPRPLAMCDIAVRILHTQYDHISCHIPQFQAQQKAFISKPYLLVVEEDTETQVQDQEAIEDQGAIEDQEAIEDQKAVEEQKITESKYTLEAKLLIGEELRLPRPMRTRSALTADSRDELRKKTPSSVMSSRARSLDLFHGVQWRTDGIHNVTFDPETKLISFKMDMFNTFTLIQGNYVNMPFQSWEIKPVGENEALLTVSAALNVVEIQIKDLCQLCPVSIEDNLSHIRGKWMTASSLIIAMINAGLNIFPGNESEKYVKKTEKNKQQEQETYTQMALVTSAVAFRWSKWNLSCEQEEIVLQACENLTGETPEEDNWSLYLVRPERSQKLKIKESSEEWTKEIAENTELYSNVYHMMKGQASDVAKERILNTDHLFFTNVCEILQATKLLTSTAPVN